MRAVIHQQLFDLRDHDRVGNVRAAPQGLGFDAVSLEFVAGFEVLEPELDVRDRLAGISLVAKREA